VLQVLPWWLPPEELRGCGWGSHGSDNKFVFGTDHGDNTLVAAPYPRQDCPLDAGERALSDYMGARWAAFAAGDAPWWPFWKTPARGAGVASDEVGATRQQQTQTAKLEVGATSRGAPLVDFKKEDCAFWSGLGLGGE